MKADYDAKVLAAKTKEERDLIPAFVPKVPSFENAGCGSIVLEAHYTVKFSQK